MRNYNDPSFRVYPCLWVNFISFIGKIRAQVHGTQMKPHAMRYKLVNFKFIGSNLNFIGKIRVPSHGTVHYDLNMQQRSTSPGKVQIFGILLCRKGKICGTKTYKLAILRQINGTTTKQSRPRVPFRPRVEVQHQAMTQHELQISP